MPNVATMLKGEILRLARKEVRKEIESLKKASALYRSEIAGLKRRLLSLEKQVASSQRRAVGPTVTDDASEGGAKVRFSAARLSKHREKLNLSAAEYGKLLGVSGQTIYKWEAGKTRPRQAQLLSIASIRKIGKRRAKALLNS